MVQLFDGGMQIGWIPKGLETRRGQAEPAVAPLHENLGTNTRERDLSLSAHAKWWSHIKADESKQAKVTHSKAT